jgi:hypothetical protein
MKTQLFASVLFVLALVLMSVSQARACDGYGGYGYGCGLGWLYNSLDYRVPYFAAHPPVYYSYPVPRTYGYSPFAYPPGVMTPDVEMDTVPLEIINPYVPSSQQTAPEPDTDRTVQSKSTAQPLVIVNPFVAQGEKIAQAAK